MLFNKNAISFNKPTRSVRAIFRFGNFIFLLKAFSIVFVYFHSSEALAQDAQLTLQDAISQALKNNYDIKIASQEKEKAFNNNTPGNAGMLPQISLNASYVKSNSNTKQNYSSGLEVNRNNAASDNTNAYASLNWTIFDGFKMFATKQKLSELTLQGEQVYKEQVEQSVASVMTAYYAIIRQKQLLKATQDEKLLSEERVTIADRRFKNGSGSKLEFIQAKADLNAIRSTEWSEKTALYSASMEMNRLLGRDPEIHFSVEDSIIFSYHPGIDELKELVGKQNSSLLFFQRNQHIAELGIKEFNSQRWPKVFLTGNYLFSKVKNEAGLVLLNQNLGFNYGIGASLSLFNGFVLNSQVKNAKLDLLQSKTEYEQTLSSIHGKLLNAYRVFEDNLGILKLEEENISMSGEILAIAQERYRVGASNGIEWRDAQKTFEEAVTRLFNARYNAKVSEIELKQLSGELIKADRN